MGILPFYHAFAVIVIMNLALRVGVSVVSMPRFDLVKFLELASKFKATFVLIFFFSFKSFHENFIHLFSFFFFFFKDICILCHQSSWRLQNILLWKNMISQQ